MYKIKTRKELRMRISPVSQLSTESANFGKRRYTKEKNKNSHIKTAAILGTIAALGTLSAAMVLRAKKPNGTGGIKALKEIYSGVEGANDEISNIVKYATYQTSAIQDEIKKVMTDSQDMCNELKNLLKEGETVSSDGTILREIITKNCLLSKMREFSADGKLVRETEFLKGSPSHVTQTITNQDSSITEKVFSFLDGKLSHYSENLQFPGVKNSRCIRSIDFNSSMFQGNELPNTYSLMPELIDPMREKCLRRLVFKNGLPSVYMENIEDIDAFVTSFGKKIFFDSKGDVSDIVLGLNTEYEIANRAYKVIDNKWQDVTSQAADIYFNK